MGVGVDVAVQDTAFLAAAFRAAETRRLQPRISDPYAELFLHAQSSARREHRNLLAAGGDQVVERTRLVDTLLMRALAGTQTALVLNLGAGFCTRPYRLDLSGCALVEFDAAPVVALKDALLGGHRPDCAVQRIGLDLRDHELLAQHLAALDAASRPVIVVSEGLLPYLPPAASGALAQALAGGLGDAVWITDVVSTESALAMRQLARTAGANVELYGLDTLESFEDCGWVPANYQLLPASPRGPIGRSSASPAPRRPDATSRRVVDGVVAFRR